MTFAFYDAKLMIPNENILDNSLINRVASQLAQCGVTDRDQIVVGISGGPDSIFLMEMLHQLEYKIFAIHVNYKLRGPEAEGDAAFCKDFCVKNQVGLEVVEYDLAERQNDGRSIQNEAREARYNVFERKRKELSYQFVATAHHMNDHIETVLINLLRGTGLKGLTGIPEKRGNIIRPLLTISKAEILKYLEDNAIKYRVDASNKSLKYQRNRIRHQLVPLMSELSPGFESRMESNMTKWSQSHALLTSFLADWKKENVVEKGRVIQINKESLIEKNNPNMILELLGTAGFSYATCCQINEALKGETGKYFASQSHQVSVEREYVIVFPIEKSEKSSIRFRPDDTNIIETKSGTLILEKVQGKSVNELSNDQYIIPTATTPREYILRHWEEGDKLQPQGMNGKHKSVSKLLSDQKLDRVERENIMVLLENETVLWVLGVRRKIETSRVNADSAYFLLTWQSTSPF